MVFHDFDPKNLRKYLTNISWLTIERVARIFLYLFIGILVVRYLGPERFGYFAFAQSVVVLIGIIPRMGLDNIVVHTLVNGQQKHSVVLGTAFGLKLTIGIAAITILAASVVFTSLSWLEKAMIILISISFVFQAADVIDLYFQARVESKTIVKVRAIEMTLSAAAKLLLIKLRAQLLWFAGILVLESMVLAIGFFVVYSRQSRREDACFHISFPPFSWSMARKLLDRSWPLLFSGIALSVYMRIDQLMIRVMLDPSQLGQYSAAVRIAESYLFIGLVITTSFYPAILNAKKKGEEIYLDRLQRFYDLMLWLSLAISIAMSLLSNVIVYWAYGERFAPAGPVVGIYALSGIFAFVITASSRWYLTEQHETAIMYRAMSGAVVNVLLNYLLIPKHGIQGAAIATLLSYAFMAVCYDAIDPRGRRSLLLKWRSLWAPVRFLKKELKAHAST